MGNINIKVGDVVRNVKLGGTYIVVSLSQNIYLHDVHGKKDSYYFNSQFEVVSEAARAEFMSKYKRPPTKGRAKPPSPKKIAEILARFEQFEADLKKDYPGIFDQFRGIWAEMLGIVGDKPGPDWGMSKKEADKEGNYAYNPVLKTRNPKTERSVNLMQIFADGGDGTHLYLIINRKSLPQEFSHLFPEKNTYYGTGDGVRLNYSELNSKTLKPYLDCIRHIITRDRSAL